MFVDSRRVLLVTEIVNYKQVTCCLSNKDIINNIRYIDSLPLSLLPFSSLSLTLTHSHPPTHAHAHTLSCSLILSLTHAHKHSHEHAHTQLYTYTLSHSHTRTHTHTCITPHSLLIISLFPPSQRTFVQLFKCVWTNYYGSDWWQHLSLSQPGRNKVLEASRCFSSAHFNKNN